MCSIGMVIQLKQAKDPIAFRGLNKYVNFSTKLALAEARIQFIDECVTKSVFPKQYWTLLRRNRVKIRSATLRRLAVNERDTLCNHLVDLERNYVTSACALDNLSPIERKSFKDYVQSIVAKQVERIQTILRRRLNHVKPVGELSVNPEQYVHNLSCVNLDKMLLEVLSPGPVFYPNGRSKQLDVEVEFKNLYAQFSVLVPPSKLDLEKLKSTLVNACYQHQSVKVKRSELVTSEHLKRLKDLQKNREIMIYKPDKEARIVLLNRTDYV
ncbi:unnamed protein product [Echinostoma caproni]|uniref:Uncharacterized protein n=1 Tax=Echinostoma caproni TaxID=27848 RepID=A0A183AY90_9TREM|nr:unnamed protein product [Echinostoma caproni]